MTTLMIASLVTAMAAAALRFGRRRRGETRPEPLTPIVQPPQALQCPVCSGRHPAAAQKPAGP